jgi:hypothetical protein
MQETIQELSGIIFYIQSVARVYKKYKEDPLIQIQPCEGEVEYLYRRPASRREVSNLRQ